MSAVLCNSCGAELIPDTNFCRQCGAAAHTATDASEEKTTLLNQNAVDATTQRLNPRTTVGTPRPPAASALATPARSLHETTSRPRWKLPLVVGLMLFFMIVAICAAFLVSRHLARSHQASTASIELNYPGARTVVDVPGANGARALQLETSDSFDKVAAWYEAKLKPTKEIRATSNTVIMRNDNVTATIIGTEQGASIVIKKTDR